MTPPTDPLVGRSGGKPLLRVSSGWPRMISGPNSPNLGLIWPIEADSYLKIAIFGENRTFMTPPTPQKNWRMPPSFFSRKIDLFKKKICPNRTIGSKVTSFWNFQLKDFYPVKLTECTRTFHSRPKNVKTCNFGLKGPIWANFFFK